MPSKKSKQPPSKPQPDLWKAELGCAEARILEIAGELAREVKPGDRVILEGEMGTGKTTFARALLKSLGVQQPPEGSPSFAIAHEYQSPKGGVVHLDFYRIRSESEIDEAGIPEYFWERKLVVICEWLSMWPGFANSVLEAGRNWQVKLEYHQVAGKPDSLKRDIKIQLAK